jgi:hypothetical protein
MHRALLTKESQQHIGRNDTGGFKKPPTRTRVLKELGEGLVRDEFLVEVAAMTHGTRVGEVNLECKS